MIAAASPPYARGDDDASRRDRHTDDEPQHEHRDVAAQLVEEGAKHDEHAERAQPDSDQLQCRCPLVDEGVRRAGEQQQGGGEEQGEDELVGAQSLRDPSKKPKIEAPMATPTGRQLPTTSVARPRKPLPTVCPWL